MPIDCKRYQQKINKKSATKREVTVNRLIFHPQFNWIGYWEQHQKGQFGEGDTNKTKTSQGYFQHNI